MVQRLQLPPTWGEYLNNLPTIIRHGRCIRPSEIVAEIIPDTASFQEEMSARYLYEQFKNRKSFKSISVPLVINLLKLHKRPKNEQVAVLLKYGPTSAAEEARKMAGALLATKRKEEGLSRKDLLDDFTRTQLDSMEGGGAPLKIDEIARLLRRLNAGRPLWEKMSEILRQHIPGMENVTSNTPIPPTFDLNLYVDALDDSTVIANSILRAKRLGERDLVIVYDALPDEAITPDIFKHLLTTNWNDAPEDRPRIISEHEQRWRKTIPDDGENAHRLADPWPPNTIIYIDAEFITKLAAGPNQQALAALTALSQRDGVHMIVIPAGQSEGKNRRFHCKSDGTMSEIQFSVSRRSHATAEWLRKRGFTADPTGRSFKAQLILGDALTAQERRIAESNLPTSPTHPNSTAPHAQPKPRFDFL